MTMIRPFQCYHASPDLAPEVACPAYDTMTPAERHEFALAHPQNYLNVMRSTEEFPEAERPAFDDNLQRNSARLQELIGEGVFVFNQQPGFYLYRLAVDGHVQTGLIAEIPVEEFDRGAIRKHEHTRQDKEDALIRYRDTVRASSTPITLTYPASDRIDAIVQAAQQREPLIDFTADCGLHQTLWFIGEADEVQALQEAFAPYEALYLTDGHHRSAVCQRWAAMRREANPEHTGEEPYNFVLTAIFPDRENRVLAYHRLVRDLNGHDETSLLAAIGAHFDVERLAAETADDAEPPERHTFSMRIGKEWYRLTAHADSIDEADPVRSLDVCVLQERLLGPILGIEDPRLDPRIEYVPGICGLAELERRMTEDDWAIAFACFPTSVQELMAIADAGEVMPPKSTWFDPKVRSGLLVRLR